MATETTANWKATPHPFYARHFAVSRKGADGRREYVMTATQAAPQIESYGTREAAQQAAAEKEAS